MYIYISCFRKISIIGIIGIPIEKVINSKCKTEIYAPIYSLTTKFYLE